jgi:hypothetical protein
MNAQESNALPVFSTTSRAVPHKPRTLMEPMERIQMCSVLADRCLTAGRSGRHVTERICRRPEQTSCRFSCSKIYADP